MSSYSKIPSKRFLYQRISLLLQSDNGLFIIPLSKDFFIIPIRRGILYFSLLTGFLHYPASTKDSLQFQRSSLLFQSGKGFFITPLSKYLLTIPVRRGILYYSSLKGILQLSHQTNYCLLLLSHRISSLFQSAKGFFIIHFSQDFFIIPIRHESLLFLSHKISSSFQSDK